MPLITDNLQVTAAVRNSDSWAPMQRIEDLGANVETAINAIWNLSPDRRILVEGDSWFNKFTPIPMAGVNLVEWIRLPYSTAYVDVSKIGDTAEAIATAPEASGDARLLDKCDFHAILYSAGGNDLIALFQQLYEAAAAGRTDFSVGSLSVDPRKFREPASYTAFFDKLIESVKVFIALRDNCNSAASRAAPIFLHGYDYFQPRPAVAYVFGSGGIGIGPWLYPIMQKAGLDDTQMRQAADAVIDELFKRLKSDIADHHSNVFLIDHRGLLLPAAPGTSEQSNDWLDEIHPAARGFEKLARNRWEVALAKALGWTFADGQVVPSDPLVNSSTAPLDIMGRWVIDASPGPGQSTHQEFVFDSGSFDSAGNLSSWNASLDLRVHTNSGGWCINSDMSMTHHCVVTAKVDRFTYKMTDHALSCNAINYPADPGCQGILNIICGPALQDHSYTLTYRPADDTLIAAQNGGGGNEYAGTYRRAGAVQPAADVGSSAHQGHGGGSAVAATGQQKSVTVCEFGAGVFEAADGSVITL